MTDIKIVEYFRKAIGVTLKIEPFTNKLNMPLYLRTGYHLCTIKLFDRELLIAQPQSETDITPATLKKHIEILQGHTGMDIVLVLERIEPSLRKRLIELKISFIVPETQMYLPLLQIDLRERFQPVAEKRTFLSPAAQKTILYRIYCSLPMPITPGGLAAQLRYTKMTASRVVDELECCGLGTLEQKGRNRFMRIAYTGLELWEKAALFLHSPVKRKLNISFVTGPSTPNLPMAGISALAEKTMLSAGDLPVYAVSMEKFAEMQSKNGVQVVRQAYDAHFQLELWSYNPFVFGAGGMVDDLSLYLSLREDTDERIQLALKELIRNFKWQ
jgi:DNA-binding MarR family transcriptional regulator